MTYSFEQGIKQDGKSKLTIAAAIVLSAGMLITTLVQSAGAADPSTIVVTPSNTQGWSTADTRLGGSVNFVNDSSAPGEGALQLTTNATITSKAQYLHEANVPLSGVANLSYQTKQISGPVYADPSFQLPVCLGGFNSPMDATNPSGCTGFTTLVYEPYQNGVIIPNTWQSWDVDAGQFWSSRGYSSNTCTVVAGGGGAPFYKLAGLQTACPNAVAVGFGVNIGSNNPSYTVNTDLVTFNETTYDFEPTRTVANKDACKEGGWMTSNTPTYKNQGQCVSSFASNKNN